MIMHLDSDTSFLFFGNSSFQGITSLQEIIQKYESPETFFHKDIWFKSSDYAYWAKLAYHPQIALELHWDYLRDNKICTRIKGSVLLGLFKQGLITKNTPVKLTYEYDWIKFHETILFETTDITPLSTYITPARRPDWRNSLANTIDGICCILWIFGLVGFLKLLFVHSYALGTLFSVVAVLSWNLVPCFFDALWISIWGRTIGCMLTGLFIVTSRGKKLRFGQAFNRQHTHYEFLSYSRYFGNKNMSRQDKELHTFGATQWDRMHGYVVTDQPPVSE